MPGKFVAKCLCTLIAISIWSAFCAQSAQAIPPNDEWVIDQLENKFFISEKAIRAYDKTLKFDMVARAPDWKVHLFRSENKTSYSVPLKEFSIVAILRPFGADTNLKPKIPYIGPSDFKGHPCSIWQGTTGRLYTSREIVLSPKPAELISRYLFTATVPGVPLFYLKPKEDRIYKKKDWLDSSRANYFSQNKKLFTNSLTKKRYDPADFAMPTGYRQVGYAKEVVFSNRNKEEFTDLLEGIGYASTGKRK